MMRSSLLLLACLTLVLMATEEVNAGKEPEWSHDTENEVRTVAVSADGEYIVAGTGGDDDKVYLFGKDNGTLLWNTSSWEMDRDTDLSDADASFWGEDSDDLSGRAVSGVGDVNGDGYDDFIIGAYGDEDGGSSAGQIYLILGDGTGWSMDTGLSDADASFIGENDDDYSGYAVSGAGDVNGDGYDDFLIGAWSDEDGGSDAGQTYLILGKASGWAMDTDLSDADASFWGEDSDDLSGMAVSGVGDVNDDGYDDFLIGAYYNDDGGNNAGQTYLILGKAAGWSMDTNLSDADASFWGEDSDDVSGYAISGVGDVNGDGYDDFIIGAPGDEDGGNVAGQTYLILGKAAGWSMDTNLSNADASFIGEDASDYSGYAISGAGDVNGDGYDDFIIGAYGDEDGGSSAGQIYLILGDGTGWSMDTGLSDADASFIGENDDDYSGYAVSGVGDVNGDGYDDFLIGAWSDEDGGSDAGQTYLILGKAAGWSMDTNLSDADASFIGENDYDYSGYAVSGVGDVNDDGYDDFLIGAIGNDDGGNAAGQTYLILGGFAIRDRVNSVAISADGETIVAGSNDKKVYLFNKYSSTPLWSYTTEHGVQSVAVSADGEYIAAGTIVGQNVYLFNKDSNTPLWSYGAGDTVRSVAISADGEYIVAGTSDGKLHLFDKDSNTPLWTSNIESSVQSVAVSADGEYIAAGSVVYSNNSGKLYLFDKDSGTPLWSYSTGKRVYSVDISADGEYIAAGSLDDGVYLFDKDSSTPLWNYDTGDTVYSVAISANGEYITAVDYRVYLFHKDSDTPLWSYETEDVLRSVSISADGEYIAAGSDDDKVYLFDNNIPPTATIDSISPSPARFDNMEVTFNGTGTDSDGTIVAYEWTSDIDGFLSNEGDFSTTGFSIGTHTISFRVQDNGGEWSEWYNTMLVVYPNAPPVATIDSIEPSPARFDDMEVTFSSSGSDGDGTIVAYEWSCDIDGFLSDEEDFSITGFSVGNHNISFRVQDNDEEWSEWDAAELEIYPNAPPVGVIDSIEPSPAEEGAIVFFNGTGTDSDGTVVAYQWNSSIDGELSTEEDFSSNNLSFGHHTITFRVQDNDGDWGDAISELLFVFAYPMAIAGDDVSTTPTVPVQFSGQGTDEDGIIAKYEWDFDGNGVYEWSSTDNGRELNLYNNVGVYTAMLRVTDNDGFTNTDTVVITVTEKKIQIDDEGNVTVTDAEEDEEGIPTLSVITTMAAVAIMALRRRPE